MQVWTSGTCLATDVLTRKAVNKNLIDSESCQYKCLPKHIDKSPAVQFKQSDKDSSKPYFITDKIDPSLSVKRCLSSPV